MRQAFLTIYIAAVLLLGVSALGIGQMRCEGFGCMGIGVAWFAWAVGFAVVLGLGLLARRPSTVTPRLSRAAHWAFGVQLGMGACAVVVWLIKQGV